MSKAARTLIVLLVLSVMHAAASAQDSESHDVLNHDTPKRMGIAVGALSGALIGAGLGTIAAGPWGGLICGVLGGFAGAVATVGGNSYFGGSEDHGGGSCSPSGPVHCEAPDANQCRP